MEFKNIFGEVKEVDFTPDLENTELYKSLTEKGYLNTEESKNREFRINFSASGVPVSIVWVGEEYESYGACIMIVVNLTEEDRELRVPDFYGYKKGVYKSPFLRFQVEFLKYKEYGDATSDTDLTDIQYENCKDAVREKGMVDDCLGFLEEAGWKAVADSRKGVKPRDKTVCYLARR